MTPLDRRLAEIRERNEKRTQGKWRLIPGDSYCAYPHVVNSAGTKVFEDHGDHGCRQHCDGGFPGAEADAAFIAHAPDDVTLLLEVVEKMREALMHYETCPHVGVACAAECARHVKDIATDLDLLAGKG